MTPNPRGRMRFSEEEPDRGIRNLLYIIIGLLVVQLVITIGLWIDKPRADTSHTSEQTAETGGKETLQTPASQAKEPVTSASRAVKEEAGRESLVLPETIRVQILNGCGISGLARRVQEWLVHNSFDVRDVGNADRHDYKESRIIDRTGNIAAARKLAKMIGIDKANIIRLGGSPSLNVDLTLIIGKDYKKLAFAR